MQTIDLVPSANIGQADGTLDGLLVQNCKIQFAKLPTVRFFLQEIELPEITVNEVKQYTRYVDPNQIGEKVNYEPFTLRFMVDSRMRNYAEIFTWMKRMTVSGSKVDETDEVTLIVDNQQILQFHGCWPMKLGGLEFSTTEQQHKYMTCSMTLNYDYADLIGQWETVDTVYK